MLKFYTYASACLSCILGWKDVEGSYPSFTCKNNWGGICCAFASTLLFVQGNRGDDIFFLVHCYLDILGFDKASLEQWAKATQSNLCPL